MTARYSPPRPVRATRATPPSGYAPSLPARGRGVRGAASMVLIVLVLGSAGTATWFGSRSVQLQRELAQQNALLDKSVARLSEREGQLSTLLESDGALSVAHLRGDSATGGVTVYWNRRDGRTLISAYELPRLPQSRVYALWAADSVRTELLATFTTDETGRALLRQRVDPGGRSAPFELMVTVELASLGSVPNLPALLSSTVSESQ